MRRLLHAPRSLWLVLLYRLGLWIDLQSAPSAITAEILELNHDAYRASHIALYSSFAATTAAGH